MKNKVFTLVFAFLAMAGNAIWGQSTSQYDATITIDGINVSGDNTEGWSYNAGEGNNNVLEFTKEGHYFIQSTGTSHSTTNNNTNIQILIQTEGKYYITLKNVRTDAQLDGTFGGTLLYPDHCAFQIGDDSKTNVTVELDWEGSNKFWSGAKRAGINVKPGATLILAGPDTEGNSLEAGSLCNAGEDDTNGAGIGGDEIEPDFGTIIIESGYVKARCESKGGKVDAQAAGIGGGYDPDGKGTSGTIIIKGGTIEAACWSNDKGEDYNGTNGNDYAWGAGIGGGMGGTVDNIIILGGNVKAYSTKGDDIGTGANCYNHPNIIIGNAEKGGNTQVSTTDNNELTVDDTNYLDGLTNKTVTGNVTMPDGMHIYIEDLEIKDGATFKAYNVDLRRTLLGEGHTINGWEEGAEDIKNYYLGPNASIETGVLTCQGGDLFLGWYKSENDVVTIENNKTTFKAPTTLSEYTKATYYAVWVESKHPIVVETETTWTKDGDVTPSINYVPKEANDVLNALSFKFETISAPELINWKFEENQILGTTQLQENDTYQEITVKAKVKLGEGEAKKINIPVYIVEKSIINTVSVNTNQSHIYTGLNHNGSEMTDNGHISSRLYDAPIEKFLTSAWL